jgi:hypothetical protein
MYLADVKKAPQHGKLFNKIFKNYKKTDQENENNIGWNLISKNLPEAIKISNLNTKMEQYPQIKLLSPQLF